VKRFAMSILVAAIALYVGLWSAPAQASEGDFDTHFAQAKHFFKKHWLKDAATEMRAALETTEGQQSYEAHWFAAQLAWELLDIEWATESAQRAAELALEPNAAEMATRLVENYSENFGFLTIDAPHPGMVTRLQFESTSMIFDPELKRYINRVATQWREKNVLPITIGVPKGNYLVNGEAVEVGGGTEATIVLPMSRIGARGLAALQVTRSEISAGLTGLGGDHVGAQLPAARFQLALTQPIGRLLVGGFVDQTLYTYGGADLEQYATQGAWSGGARMGMEFVGKVPIAIRPSVLLRAASIPGLPIDCETEFSVLRCSSPNFDAAPEQRIYATGHAWMPGAELSLDYRQAGRTTALGSGVKFIYEYAFGGFPSEIDNAMEESDGLSTEWKNGPPSWKGNSIALLTNLSFAF